VARVAGINGIGLAQAAFFLGTLAPFLRASESPMAIACLRLFTHPPLPPLPERSVPRFLRRIALSTVLPAALPYRRPRDLPLELFRELELLFPAISFFSRYLEAKRCRQVVRECL
jgi:hypothetical protein